jgi:hypothetical protein
MLFPVDKIQCLVIKSRERVLFALHINTSVTSEYVRHMLETCKYPLEFEFDYFFRKLNFIYTKTKEEKNTSDRIQ